MIPAGRVAPARNLEDESAGVANAEFVLNLLEARGEGELPRAAHREGPRVDLPKRGAAGLKLVIRLYYRAIFPVVLEVRRRMFCFGG